MARPDPIPNSAVKRCVANGSACRACARVGRCRVFLLPSFPFFSLSLSQKSKFAPYPVVYTQPKVEFFLFSILLILSKIHSCGTDVRLCHCFSLNPLGNFATRRVRFAYALRYSLLTRFRLINPKSPLETEQMVENRV